MVAPHRGQRTGGPGIPHIARGPVEGVVVDAGVRRGIVAQRQHDAIGLDHLPAREVNHGPLTVRVRAHVAGLIAHRLERVVSRARGGVGDDSPEVVAIHTPRHEGPAGDFGHPLTRKPEEVILLFRECAHPACGDIEHVARLAGPVCHASRDWSGLVDQDDAHREVPGPSQEVGGDHRTAEAGADDDDGAAGGIGHGGRECRDDWETTGFLSGIGKSKATVAGHGPRGFRGGRSGLTWSRTTRSPAWRSRRGRATRSSPRAPRGAHPSGRCPARTPA